MVILMTNTNSNIVVWTGNLLGPIIGLWTVSGSCKQLPRSLDVSGILIINVQLQQILLHQFLRLLQHQCIFKALRYKNVNQILVEEFRINLSHDIDQERFLRGNFNDGFT